MNLKPPHPEKARVSTKTRRFSHKAMRAIICRNRTCGLETETGNEEKDINLSQNQDILPPRGGASRSTMSTKLVSL